MYIYDSICTDTPGLQELAPICCPRLLSSEPRVLPIQETVLCPNIDISLAGSCRSLAKIQISWRMSTKYRCDYRRGIRLDKKRVLRSVIFVVTAHHVSVSTTQEASLLSQTDIVVFLSIIIWGALGWCSPGGRDSSLREASADKAR